MKNLLIFGFFAVVCSIFFSVSIVKAQTGEYVAFANYILSGAGLVVFGGLFVGFMIYYAVLYKKNKNSNKVKAERDLREQEYKTKAISEGKLYLTSIERENLKKFVNGNPAQSAKCPICCSPIENFKKNVTEYEERDVEVEGLYNVIGTNAYRVTEKRKVPVIREQTWHRCPKCRYEWYFYLHKNEPQYKSYRDSDGCWQEKYLGCRDVPELKVNWGDLKNYMD